MNDESFRRRLLEIGYRDPTESDVKLFKGYLLSGRVVMHNWNLRRCFIVNSDAKASLALKVLV